GVSNPVGGSRQRRQPEVVHPGGGLHRPVHGDFGQPGGQRRAADDLAGAERRANRPAVDRLRLHHRLRVAPNYHRRPRRPVGSQTLVPDWRGDLHRHLGGGRLRQHDRAPDRRSRPPRGRRRVHHAALAVLDLRRLPAGGAGQGARDLVGGLDLRSRLRADRRRHDRRVRELELGLPDQHPDRDRRLHRHLGGGAGIARPIRHRRHRHPRHRPGHRGDRGPRLRPDRSRQPGLDRRVDPGLVRGLGGALCGVRDRREPDREADGAALVLPLLHLHRRQSGRLRDLVPDLRRRLLDDALPAERPRLLPGPGRVDAAAAGNHDDGLLADLRLAGEPDRVGQADRARNADHRRLGAAVSPRRRRGELYRHRARPGGDGARQLLDLCPDDDRGPQQRLDRQERRRLGGQRRRPGNRLRLRHRPPGHDHEPGLPGPLQQQQRHRGPRSQRRRPTGGGHHRRRGQLRRPDPGRGHPVRAAARPARRLDPRHDRRRQRSGLRPRDGARVRDLQHRDRALRRLGLRPDQGPGGPARTRPGGRGGVGAERRGL
ncbi:MAG: Uncharacterized MFS-type transporter, partial [uncultured Thermomicrobiales bacterium]